MLVRHKGIYPNRFDAPFIGTLISAITCPYSCPGCINDPMKTPDYDTMDSDEILNDIVLDFFSEGIILGGLCWTCQPDELIALIDGALERNLKVILYTYLPDQTSLYEKVPEMRKYLGSGIYVKFGKYDETRLVPDNIQYGIALASSNQYIIQL